MTKFLIGVVRYAAYTSLMLLCMEAVLGAHLSSPPRLLLLVVGITALVSGLLGLLELRLRPASPKPGS